MWTITREVLANSHISFRSLGLTDPEELISGIMKSKFLKNNILEYQLSLKNTTLKLINQGITDEDCVIFLENQLFRDAMANCKVLCLDQNEIGDEGILFSPKPHFRGIDVSKDNGALPQCIVNSSLCHNKIGSKGSKPYYRR